MSSVKIIKNFFAIACSLNIFLLTAHDQTQRTPVISETNYNALAHTENMIIIGGGMAGAMEAYLAHLDAKKNNTQLHITIYEKNRSLSETTVANIVPSLTPDEILSVVPRGQELIKKSEILFSEPGGIRVDDVAGISGTDATKQFQHEVQQYSLDEIGHNERTQCLLSLGKMSMDLWQNIFNTADNEMKEILRSANYNPCCQLTQDEYKALHEGYRIDLIYAIPNVRERAENMKRDYEGLGYKHCTILTPAQVMEIDPFLTDFCKNHSEKNSAGNLEWHNDAVALWRPGGCIDAQVLLPKIYEYLKKNMGTYTNAHGNQEDCFQIKFGHKVTSVEYDTAQSGETIISGISIETEQGTRSRAVNDKTTCVFCPGEAIGTLKKLGLKEPAYAGFAGASLLLTIDIPEEKLKKYAQFNHCMEVHQEGVVLAWQARFRDNKIFIGVAGTKAFYSDQKPNKDQAFAKNRNLLQLTMINDVLPEFISLALGRDTKGKTLTNDDLNSLESRGIARRWAGVRAVVFDGFPTLGCVYKDECKIINARCTTHLGSGGASFSPASVMVSRASMNSKDANQFIQKVLHYADSARTAQCMTTK